MSGFRYENQGNYTYLVREIASDETVDTMSLGMLTNNKIPGLAQTVFAQMDSTKYVKFNVSAKISADQVFEGVVNRKRLLGVLKAFVAAMTAAEEYMLDTNSILLDLKYIFTDVTTCESVLICLPVVCEDGDVQDPKTFLKDMIYNTQFDQTENCDYIAKIINYLNGAVVFSMAEFKKILDEIEQGGECRQQPAPVSQPAPQPEGKTTKTGRAARRAEEKLTAPKRTEEKPLVPPQFQAPMGVPPMPGREGAVPPVPPVFPAQEPEKEAESISWFYLMQHYNKENAAAYKRQKESKKAGKKSGKNEPPAKAKKQAAENMAVPGFAIPGQPAPQAAPQQAVTPVQMPSRPIAPMPVPGNLGMESSVKTDRPILIPSMQQAAGQDGDFGNTSYFMNDGEGEGTVIMNQTRNQQQLAPHLFRRKNNERIPLNKPVFRLGRDFDFNDYAILDNKFIGHTHCHVISRDGEYFVQDDNSKNHTSVNGAVISSGTEVKITHGDTICLADEEFEFKLF